MVEWSEDDRWSVARLVSSLYKLPSKVIEKPRIRLCSLILMHAMIEMSRYTVKPSLLCEAELAKGLLYFQFVQKVGIRYVQESFSYG